MTWLRAALGMMALGLFVLAGCTAPAAAVPAAPPAPVVAPAPRVTVSPPDGATGVAPAQPVTVTAANGTLSGVTVTTEDGDAGERAVRGRDGDGLGGNHAFGAVGRAHGDARRGRDDRGGRRGGHGGGRGRAAREDEQSEGHHPEGSTQPRHTSHSGPPFTTFPRQMRSTRGRRVNRAADRFVVMKSSAQRYGE